MAGDLSAFVLRRSARTVIGTSAPASDPLADVDPFSPARLRITEYGYLSISVPVRMASGQTMSASVCRLIHMHTSLSQELVLTRSSFSVFCANKSFLFA
jgi:hypothetical protein